MAAMLSLEEPHRTGSEASKVSRLVSLVANKGFLPGPMCIALNLAFHLELHLELHLRFLHSIFQPCRILHHAALLGLSRLSQIARPNYSRHRNVHV